MRALGTKDLFSFCRVVDALDAKDILKEGYFKGQQAGADAEDIGFDVVYGLFQRASSKKSEALIYEFLAGPFEKTTEEIELLELPELFEGVKKLAVDAQLPAFFKFAADRMK